MTFDGAGDGNRTHVLSLGSSYSTIELHPLGGYPNGLTAIKLVTKMNDKHPKQGNFHPRSVRSFVRRQGRMTQRQEHALDQLWPRFGVEVPAGELNFKTLFGNEAPVVLEIGFGMGQSLCELAKQNPQSNFLGIEVHRPGVGSLLTYLEEHQISNVRIMIADAKDILERHIPAQSLAAVLLFFPDPWPKKRHQKRRLVQAVFVDCVASRLKEGGYFHMATDWEDYALQMLAVASECEALDNTAGQGSFIARPSSRPLTKFEKRGQKLGHGVWDLVLQKTGVKNAF